MDKISFRGGFFSFLIFIPFLLSAQIFYKVEGNGLKTPSYIFGTHHLAPLSVLDDMPEVSEAFSECEAVVGEVDMTDMMKGALVLQQYMVAPADSTLLNIYGDEEFQRLNKEFQKWTGGLDLSMFNNLRPLVAGTTVGASMVAKDLPGTQSGETLDTFFQTAGKQAGKEIKALESIEEQAQFLFGSISIADQAKALREQLDNPEKAMAEARLLNKCYFEHDIERLLRETVAENENPQFFETLLYHRNANWLNRLPDIFAESPAFVAVGALHLAGEKGIVAGLRELGFTVSPL